MSLLDDVSIVVTPNGYKAGELYAVIPVPTEGAEEVTNGDFATDSDWTKGTGWSISGGSANSDGANSFSSLSQASVLTIGKRYKLIVDINLTSGQLRIQEGGVILETYTTTGANTATYYFIATATNITFKTSVTPFNGSIDNVSVKEYTSADMDVTRATAGTRVDENGLVNYAEVIGDEEITNGDFATDSNWTLSSGITYNASKYLDFNLSSGQAKNTPNITFVAGKTYKVSYEIKNYSAGTIKFRFQNGINTFGSQQSGDGVKTEFVICLDSSNNNFQFFGSSSFVGSIDNVSVKEVARDNVPRIDYTGGGCPHILAEPQRTNNIQYSEDFTQSYWRKDKLTVTANSIISPSGQLDASLIQETVYTGGIPSFDLLSSITLGTGSHTFTFYVKNNNSRYLGISFGSIAQRVRTNFDFTTNTFKTLIFNGTTTGSASFTTLGDYYRISITATFPSSTAADTVIMPLATDTYPFYAFQDSDNRSFYLWGTQLEAGSYATSYIPTSGSTVTRNQDIFTRDGIGSLINSTEGVLFVEMAALSNDGTNRDISISDGTLNNRIYVFYTSSSNQISVQCKVGNVTQFSFTESISNATDFIKLAIKYKENDFALWIDGVEVDTDNSGITFSADTLNQLQFAVGGTYARFFGKVRQLQVYKTALTDTQLAALTS